MIDVSGLAYTYPGASTPTLSGISFSIAPGEIYGLLGPSGAGKSTTQRIMLGLVRGYSGSARLFGQNVSSLGSSLYERIGVSFELPALYLRLTALENLRLFAGLYDRRCKDPLDVLAEVDLAEAAGQRVEQFSKGMKMRLNLARAMLHDPDVYFLDEPTTGQDPARSRLTRNLLLKLKSQGRTIFLTTHNMLEAEEICDRVAFLAQGRILASGSPSELKAAFGERLVDVTLRSAQGHIMKSFPMDGLGQNPDFLDLLRLGDIEAIHSREASLDDVFIRTTQQRASRPE